MKQKKKISNKEFFKEKVDTDALFKLTVNCLNSVLFHCPFASKKKNVFTVASSSFTIFGYSSLTDVIQDLVQYSTRPGYLQNDKRLKLSDQGWE